MRVAALLLSAGRGERLRHSLPKALVPLAGRPLFGHALKALIATPEIDLVVPVVPAAMRATFESALAHIGAGHKCAPIVAGGAERQDSVAAGLESLPDDVGWVAVHDAARPRIQPEDISRVVKAAREGGAAILAVPSADTLKRVREERVMETLPRGECWAAQTPQVFAVELLREALRAANAEARRGSDCSQLVEALGVPIRVVEGDPGNFKITGPRDLALAEALRGVDLVRIGHGWDAHQLVPGRPLRLGGLQVPHDRGLAGHSDGDVLLHAVASAMLGALGAGDLGSHFPSSDPALEGIASSEVLAQVRGVMESAGFAIGNLDTTLIAQEPRLGARREALRDSLASLLRVAPSQVSVKITSSDRLGAIGRGEGIAAEAVVLLVPA